MSFLEYSGYYNKAKYNIMHLDNTVFNHSIIVEHSKPLNSYEYASSTNYILSNIEKIIYNEINNKDIQIVKKEDFMSIFSNLSYRSNCSCSPKIYNEYKKSQFSVRHGFAMTHYDDEKIEVSSSTPENLLVFFDRINLFISVKEELHEYYMLSRVYFDYNIVNPIFFRVLDRSEYRDHIISKIME